MSTRLSTSKDQFKWGRIFSRLSSTKVQGNRRDPWNGLAKPTQWPHRLYGQGSTSNKPRGSPSNLPHPKSGANPMVFSMETKTLEEVPVVNEYPMSFPKNFPVCHQIGT